MAQDARRRASSGWSCRRSRLIRTGLCQRLADDHNRAGELAVHLNNLESIGKATNQTNMVFLDTSDDLRDLKTYLLENDVIVNGGRLVFHKDISDSDLDRLLSVITEFARNR